MLHVHPARQGSQQTKGYFRKYNASKTVLQVKKPLGLPLGEWAWWGTPGSDAPSCLLPHTPILSLRPRANQCNSNVPRVGGRPAAFLANRAGSGRQIILRVYRRGRRTDSAGRVPRLRRFCRSGAAPSDCPLFVFHCRPRLTVVDVRSFVCDIYSPRT